MSCGVGRRSGSDPALLWLWGRPAAAAPIPPLAWELTFASDVAVKKMKRKKKTALLKTHKEQQRAHKPQNHMEIFPENLIDGK